MHMSVIFSQSFQFIRKHLMACFGILLFLVAAYLFGPKLLLGPQVLVETVIQKDFSQSIVASGHVESPHRVSLGSQITGTVLRIPVAEGEHVKSGASLIELESSELIANLKQATLTISLAKAKLRQLRELQKPQAEQAFKQAQINFETAQRATLRSQKLLSQGFLNQAAVDESQRAEQVAQAQMYSVEQQVSSLRTGGSDEVLAKENLAQAQAAREAALARLNYSHIRAPVAGTLIARNVEAGDIVQPGKILMVLSPDANAGETQLVIQIDERNLRLLSLGQKAFASADAFPQQRFVAELVYINPGIDLQRGSVEAKLKVSDPPDYLKQDMTVSVDIQVAQRKSAVLLAATAIHDIDSSAPWVLLVTKGKVQRVSVRLGLRSNGMIEIVEGLQNQDQVLPLSAVNIGEGKRIRPIAQRTGGG